MPHFEESSRFGFVKARTVYMKFWNNSIPDNGNILLSVYLSISKVDFCYWWYIVQLDKGFKMMGWCSVLKMLSYQYRESFDGDVGNHRTILEFPVLELYYGITTSNGCRGEPFVM